MTTISRPETTAPVHAPRRNRWLAWLSVVLLIVGLGAGFLVGRATKADPPADLASTSAVAVMNDFAEAVNRGDASAIAAFFTEDAISVLPDEAPQGVTVAAGAQRIGDSLASLNELLGVRITGPGTAVQNGAWVTQPVEISDRPGFNVVQLVDGKIAYQVLVFDNPMKP